MIPILTIFLVPSKIVEKRQETGCASPFKERREIDLWLQSVKNVCVKFHRVVLVFSLIWRNTRGTEIS